MTDDHFSDKYSGKVFSELDDHFSDKYSDYDDLGHSGKVFSDDDCDSFFSPGSDSNTDYDVDGSDKGNTDYDVDTTHGPEGLDNAEGLADKLDQLQKYFPQDDELDEDDDKIDFWSLSHREAECFVLGLSASDASEPVVDEWESLSPGEAECFVRGLAARASSQQASS